MNDPNDSDHRRQEWTFTQMLMSVRHIERLLSGVKKMAWVVLVIFLICVALSVGLFMIQTADLWFWGLND